MSAQLFQRYSTSLLLSAVATFGLFSCGGGEPSSGDALPAGSQLDMTLPLTAQVGDDQVASDFVIQLFGNGTDKPGAKFNATSQDGTTPKSTFIHYRRTSPEKAVLQGSLVLAQGQITLPGPIVVTYYDTASVNMDITYNASSMHENATGTCTGRLYFEATVDAGGAGVVFTSDGGTVSYYTTGQ